MFHCVRCFSTNVNAIQAEAFRMRCPRHCVWLPVASGRYAIGERTLLSQAFWVIRLDAVLPNYKSETRIASQGAGVAAIHDSTHVYQRGLRRPGRVYLPGR